MYYRQVPPCMMCGQMPIMSTPDNLMPMANMPTNIMPMAAMPIEDNDLEMLYPRVYFTIIPMVRVHCDKLEAKYGVFFCPSKDEMEDIIEEIAKRFDKDMDDDDDKNKKGKKDKCREDECISCEDDVRQRRRFGRRRLLRDLIGVLFLNELFDRRRRRRPHHHGYGGFGGYGGY